MKHFEAFRSAFVVLCACTVIVCAQVSRAEPATGTLECTIGTSSQWGSSWCDLPAPLDFSRNSTVEISTDPDGARAVLIRFLTAGNDPNSPVGLVGGKVLVPANGVIVITLNRDYKHVQQVSVHGGPAPWGHHFGPDNKGANIISVTVRP